MRSGYAFVFYTQTTVDSLPLKLFLLYVNQLNTSIFYSGLQRAPELAGTPASEQVQGLLMENILYYKGAHLHKGQKLWFSTPVVC